MSQKLNILSLLCKQAKSPSLHSRRYTPTPPPIPSPTSPPSPTLPLRCTSFFHPHPLPTTPNPDSHHTLHPQPTPSTSLLIPPDGPNPNVIVDVHLLTTVSIQVLISTHSSMLNAVMINKRIRDHSYIDYSIDYSD